MSISILKRLLIVILFLEIFPRLLTQDKEQQIKKVIKELMEVYEELFRFNGPELIIQAGTVLSNYAYGVSGYSNTSKEASTLFLFEPIVKHLTATAILKWQRVTARWMPAATEVQSVSSQKNLMHQPRQATHNPLPAHTPDWKHIEVVADSLAQAYISSGVTPGMSVAVAKDGQILFARGYGKADVAMNVDAGPETVYKIGSITKQFTAAIIMRLVEAEKISHNDAITKLLPDYPTQGHHIMVRHLLNHTSGIKHYTSLLYGEKQQQFRLDLSYKEMVTLFGTQPFDLKPGEKYQYNNSAYYLLGEIIGTVTGMTFESYVEQSLLQSLELKQTRYCEHSRIIPNLAEGYEYADGELMNAPYVSMRTGIAAGILCSPFCYSYSENVKTLIDINL